jgi:hypothetical protein
MTKNLKCSGLHNVGNWLGNSSFGAIIVAVPDQWNKWSVRKYLLTSLLIILESLTSVLVMLHFSSFSFATFKMVVILLSQCINLQMKYCSFLLYITLDSILQYFLYRCFICVLLLPLLYIYKVIIYFLLNCDCFIYPLTYDFIYFLHLL